MRIRRNASRLLGGAAIASSPAPAPSDPPRFELPLPPPTAPADESPDGLAASEASSDSDGEPPDDLVPSKASSDSDGKPCCVFSQSPWDLMATLDLSDPEAEELFEDTYCISPVQRASWLSPSRFTMPALGSIKEEKKKVVEMVDEVTHKAVEMVDAVGSIKEEKKAAIMIDEVTHMAAKTTEGKKNESEPTNKEITVKKEVWACKRNDGKGWFCRRPASKPTSYCLYHYNKKPQRKRPVVDVGERGSKQPHRKRPVVDLGEGGSKKPHRKRSVIDEGEGFCYYAGFGPPRSTKRQCRSSGRSSVPEESPLPAKQQKEAVPSEMNCDISAGQADDTTHQVTPASARVKVPRLNDNTANIASCEKESGDDDVFGWNGEQYLDITKRKIPFKKRCRKPVKARSLKSLIYPVVE